jgi:glutamine cyclotransferase
MRVVAKIKVIGKPFTITAGGSSVWVATRDDSSLVEIDRRTNKALSRTAAYGGGGLAFADPYVWTSFGSALFRIDSRSGARSGGVEVTEPGLGELIVAESGEIWVGSFRVGAVFRVDPVNEKVLQKFDLSKTPHSNDISGIAEGGGAIWAVNSDDATLYRIDRSGASASAVPA